MSHRVSTPRSRRIQARGPLPSGRCARPSPGTSTVPSSVEPSAAAISGSVHSRRFIRAATRWPMSASRKNSRAPATMSCILVGGAAPVGRAADPMTTMPALLAAGSASSSFFMASCSDVRSFSSAVRACTLSTVFPGSAALARSVMRRLVSATFFRSASVPVAASGSVLPPAIRVAKVTSCWATCSESCCA